MTQLTAEELKTFIGKTGKKEATRIAGSFKENYIYSGPQHELVQKMAKALLAQKKAKTNY
jgi:hypothetical protein